MMPFHLRPPGQRSEVLIAQLSDLHVGGERYDESLLRTAVAEVNEARPDLVVVAGDLTGEGYLDEFVAARDSLAALAARVVVVPGNHDARNFGWVRFEEVLGDRYVRERHVVDGIDVALVAADTSQPDIDSGEIGRNRYSWIRDGLADDADLRLFVCHHHLVPIPGTGRARAQIHDAGDVLSLLRDVQVDLVLCGHKHVPYVWPIAGMLVVHSGTASSYRTRGVTEPSYNLLRIDEETVAVELCVPGGRRESLGEYPRRWPAPFVGRGHDPISRHGLYLGFRDSL